MATSTFSKNYGNSGYTYREALEKKYKVDDAHSGIHSQWGEAQIVPDPRGGYQVVISTTTQPNRSCGYGW